MKVLITSAVLLSSFAQAQEFRTLKITNLTYPSNSITIECLNEECDSMSVGLNDVNSNEYGIMMHLERKTLLETVLNRRAKEFKNIHTYTPYKLTRNQITPIKKHINEAYYGKAVLNTLLTPITAAIDTLGLPVSAISVLTSTSSNKRDSRKDKRAAKRLLANLDSSLDEMVIKHKYYKEILVYLHDATVMTSNSTGNENKLISDFLNGTFKNCYINLGVAGWASQIYVDNKFRGNYASPLGLNDGGESWEKFVEVLSELSSNGTCIIK